MRDFPGELAGAAAVSPPDADVLQIRARAADAILGPAPSKKAEAASARRVRALVVHLLSHGQHAALPACLFGFAWPYFSGLTTTVVPRLGVESAEIGRTAQMAEELSALKASVGAMRAAQSLSAKDATILGNTKPRLDAAKAETSVAIAELAGKVEHMQRESAAKLSQVSERFDRIEHQIAALIAAAPTADGSSSAAPVARKRAQGGPGDAFDPSQNPTAPGVPRSLGSLAPAARANNSAAENPYGQSTN
jgi:hypothetical protein